MSDEVTPATEVSESNNDVFRVSLQATSDPEKYDWYEPYYDDDKQYSGLLGGD